MLSQPKAAMVAPIISILVLVLGSGFYTTLTSLDLQDQLVAPWIIGCISSAYFCGWVISAFWVQHFILRVGHIRAFAALACSMTVVTLLQGLFFSLSLWVVLRFISGFTLAGLCVVIESWLMASSTKDNRGTMLAVYMIAYYAAQSFSQLFLSIQFAHDLQPYVIVALFVALSVVPVSATRFQAPCPEDPQLLPFKVLFKKAPMGICGAFCAGLILSVVYTLFPLYLGLIDKIDQDISFIMMVTILGGTLCQYPIGKLSDLYDGRKVLLVICGLGLVAVTFFLPNWDADLWLCVLGFILGGTSFAIYPLATSHTVDRVHSDDMVSAICSLLLAYGIGSALGPHFAPLFMLGFDANGIFVFLGTIFILLMAYTLYRIKQKAPPHVEEHVDFYTLTRTTPNAVPNDTSSPHL